MGEWKTLKIDSGTGWKSIYREAGTGWKALTWEGVAIDVGDACIDRSGYASLNDDSYMNVGNAANANGTLTNICTHWKAVDGYDVLVGIFYLVSGTTYKCRSVANIGHVSAGINNDAVSLSIQIGDLIGVYSSNTSMQLERNAAGYSGVRKYGGNACVVDQETNFSILYAGDAISVYGTG